MRQLLVVGVCLVVSSPAIAQQQSQSRGVVAEQAGNWEVVVQAEKTALVRTVSGAVPMAIRTGDNSLSLIVSSPDSSVPNILRFDTGLAITLLPTATAASSTMKTVISASNTPALIHALTAGKVASLNIGEKSFPISLSGTSPAVDALNFFGKEHGLNLPPPFASAPDLGSETPDAEAVQTADPPAARPVQLAPTPLVERNAPQNPPPAPPSETPTAPATTGADTEATLVEITDRGRATFDAGTNDLAKGASRPVRARALCAALPSRQAVNWTGTVETLSSSNDGHGVLVLRIGPHVTIGTTNNGMSDNLASLHTLIDPGSALFTTAAGLHTGQKVMFSGTFASGVSDCFDPQSLTQEGAMDDPEFLFQFNSISPV